MSEIQKQVNLMHIADGADQVWSRLERAQLLGQRVAALNRAAFALELLTDGLAAIRLWYLQDPDRNKKRGKQFPVYLSARNSFMSPCEARH